mmetsp:Transcript_45788/g.69997  ORF Transcript_45788/g.69997 Transcript_45788/m.69997 type:complete len:135 (+) Transcript_45788:303-707(+)
MGVQLCRRNMVHDQRRILFVGVGRSQRLEVDCRQFVLLHCVYSVFDTHVDQSALLLDTGKRYVTMLGEKMSSRSSEAVDFLRVCVESCSALYLGASVRRNVQKRLSSSAVTPERRIENILQRFEYIEMSKFRVP